MKCSNACILLKCAASTGVGITGVGIAGVGIAVCTHADDVTRKFIMIGRRRRVPPKFVCRVRCQIPLHELPRDLSWTCRRLPRDTPTNSTCRVRSIPRNFPETSRRQVVDKSWTFVSGKFRWSFGEVRVMEFRHYIWRENIHRQSTVWRDTVF